MKSKEVLYESGAESTASSIGEIRHSVSSAPDGELSQSRLINIRVLAGKEYCRKVAATLRPLGLVISGFQEDPKGNPGIFRMFLVGSAGDDNDVHG